MRILSILLIILNFSFAQSQSSKNLLIDKAPCTFEMTIAELTDNELNFKCDETYENQPFGIENFKIKFIRNASIFVSGNSLNGKSISLARKLKTGDYVTIFDIENININGKKSQEFKTLIIKIIKP